MDLAVRLNIWLIIPGRTGVGGTYKGVTVILTEALLRAVTERDVCAADR